MAVDFVAGAHGVVEAAKLEYYSRTDTRYRINFITGEKTVSSTSYTLICKMYTKNTDGSYTYYKSYEWHKQA